MLLSKMPMLFERLARRDQARLLKILVQQVVVDQSGNIIEVRLNSPFAYLNDLAQVAADRSRSQETLAVFEGSESPAEMLAFASRASVVELHALAGASE
jgi:hypothetical protein